MLTSHCEAVGRDPHDIKRTVNLAIAWTEESLQSQFGVMANAVRPGVLTGSDEEVIDRIGQYVEAGAEQINRTETFEDVVELQTQHHADGDTGHDDQRQ